MKGCLLFLFRSYHIEEEEMKKEDFDDRVDILPVSDPNSATMAQRIMQYQAALQLAATSPEMSA